MPARQQHGPHGVVPAVQGDGPTVVGPEHVTATARRGLPKPSKLARKPPSATASARRRETGAAIARVRSSKLSSLVMPLVSMSPTCS
jgi:hypothetical protein